MGPAGVAAGIAASVLSPTSTASPEMDEAPIHHQEQTPTESSGPEDSLLGDLTDDEIGSIQAVVDEAGRPIDVVGSAATGDRRNVGTDLPIGKGLGTKSDIDYVAPPSSHPNFNGLNGQLPSLDPKTGIIPGTPNPHIGPSIRFEPGVKPRF